MSEEGRIFECAGVRLFARDSGEAPIAGREPVLLLHGFTGNGACLSGVAQSLAADFRVVAPDLVGHGASELPDDGSHYRMEAVLAQLLALLDALGIGRAHLVGYSMGGRVALSFAAAHPERVARGVTVGASAGLADARAREARVRSDRALADRILREGIEAFVDHWMSIPLFESQRRLGAAALAAAREQRLACSPEGLARSLRGMGSGAQPPLHEALASISAPWLLVAGDEDAKFCEIADRLAEALPRGRSVRVRDAGHAAHLENPEAFAGLLLPFLRVPRERTSLSKEIES